MGSQRVATSLQRGQARAGRGVGWRGGGRSSTVIRACTCGRRRAAARQHVSAPRRAAGTRQKLHSRQAGWADSLLIHLHNAGDGICMGGAGQGGEQEGGRQTAAASHRHTAHTQQSSSAAARRNATPRLPGRGMPCAMRAHNMRGCLPALHSSRRSTGASSCMSSPPDASCNNAGATTTLQAGGLDCRCPPPAPRARPHILFGWQACSQLPGMAGQQQGGRQQQQQHPRSCAGPRRGACACWPAGSCAASGRRRWTAAPPARQPGVEGRGWGVWRGVWGVGGWRWAEACSSSGRAREGAAGELAAAPAGGRPEPGAPPPRGR
jgi:hypothetical protein